MLVQWLARERLESGHTSQQFCDSLDVAVCSRPIKVDCRLTGSLRFTLAPFYEPVQHPFNRQ